MKRILFIVFMLVSWPCLAWGTDYYVRDSTYSSGNNDGTSYTDAWQGDASINWATVDSGDGKLFVCGTISDEQFLITQDGEDGTPIHLISCTTANGASVDDPGIIDLRPELTNWDTDIWTQDGGADRYYIDASGWTSDGDLRRFWYNTGSGLTEGQELTAAASVDTLGEWFWDNPNDRVYVYAPSGTSPDNYYTDMRGAYINALYYVVYISAGDWVTIEDLEIRGGAVHGMYITASDNVVITGNTVGYGYSGISVAGLQSGAYTEATNVTVSNNTVDSQYTLDNTTSGIGSDNGIRFYANVINSSITNNTVKNWGHVGIVLENYDDDIAWGADGETGLEGNTISGNTVHAPDLEYGIGFSCLGVRTGGGAAFVENNTFKQNFIHNLPGPGAQIACESLTFINNIISTITDNQRTADNERGIYISAWAYGGDELYCQDNTIANNTVLETDEPGLHLSAGNTSVSGHIIKNNIFYNTGRNSNGASNPYSLYMENDANLANDTDIFYNDFFSSTRGAGADEVDYRGTDNTVTEFNGQTEGDGNINLDPLLINAGGTSASDYYITASSPCIDAGYCDVGFSIDYSGNTRDNIYVKDIDDVVYYDCLNDIGAYEFSDSDDCDKVTNGDTSGDLETAADDAGVGGIMYVCAGTYTDTEIDGDSELDIAHADFSLIAVGTVTLVDTSETTNLIHISGTGQTVQGFTITQGDTGINSQGSTFTISDNTISGCRIGIRSRNDDVGVATINNNTISSLTVGDASNADGIVLLDADADGDGDYSECVVNDNDISGYRDDGIDLIRAIGATVRNNIIHDNGSGANGHAIKAGGADADDNIIHSNFIYNIDANDAINTNGGDDGRIYNNILVNISGDKGIELGANNTGWSIYNNTIIMAAAGSDGIFMSSSATATIQNNIISSPGPDYDLDCQSATVTGGYNCFVNDAGAYCGADFCTEVGNYTNTDSADLGSTKPLFIIGSGTYAANYELKPNSPCIDTGTSLMHTSTTVTDDYDGKCRPKNYKYDIGAYEYDDGTDRDCFIDDTYYTVCTSGCDKPEIEDILDAYDLDSGDTMYLLSDISETEQIAWNTGDSGDANGDVTLDLNDYTVTLALNYLINLGSNVDYIAIKNGTMNVGGVLLSSSTGCSNVEVSDLDVTLDGVSTAFVNVSQGSGESFSVLDVYDNVVRGRTDGNYNNAMWLTGDIDDVDIYNNMFINILQGVYISDASNNYPTDLDIYNNTIHSALAALKALTSGVVFNYVGVDNNDGTTIKNNIFSDLNYGVSDDSNNTGDPTLGYNCYYSSNSGDVYQCSKGTGHVSGVDPKFSDATGTAKSNYYLDATSPCINSGIREAYDDGVTTDIAGKARKGLMDIGAYELNTNRVYVRFRSGNDNNNGVSSAWKTMKNTSLLPGAYVYFLERYTGNITISESGTSTDKIYLDFVGNKHKGNLTVTGNYVDVLRRR